MADGKGPRGWKRALVVFLAVLGTLVVYAYGFQVTDVSLEEIRSERRREGLVRILRALARPDLITYDEEPTHIDAPIMVPCPEGGFEPPLPETDGPYIEIDPPCADPRADVVVRGFDFEPGRTGTINFIPPSDVTLRRGDFRADRSGRFEVTINLPARPDDRVQTIRAITIQRTGEPQLTGTARDTWDKIIETVFLALLATTLGTALAVPLSFVAARNLMRDISTPLTTLALSLLAVPIGVVAGMEAAAWASMGADLLAASPITLVTGLVLLPIGILRVFRWALPPVEAAPPSPAVRAIRAAGLVVAVLAGIITLYLVGSLSQGIGSWLQPRLGAFRFLGKFLQDIGDILGFGIGLVSAIFGAGVFVGLAGRLGTSLRRRLPRTATRVLGLVLAALAGAVVMILIGSAVAWLYETRDPVKTFWMPAAIGSAAGLALSLRAWRRESVKIGLSIYYIARTVFNTLRSIEPLVMVLVFVVWVGIGPFAGTLALALHTIAALAKLYSEQVESILPGPLEAIRATGATRLQTVVYAVFPQIVPPYISFTMYRWDINVRMSTIIGFAGGGGIGFLLQQNINLLNYRAAAAQMLAIAVVVASMDYLSSRLRERFV